MQFLRQIQTMIYKEIIEANHSINQKKFFFDFSISWIDLFLKCIQFYKKVQIIDYHHLVFTRIFSVKESE